MQVFGIVGWKNSGKTTLITRLIPELERRGLTVVTVKHAHCDIEVDDPGTDSHRHRMAGARQVVIASPDRWAVIKELRGQPEPNLNDLLAKLDPVDIVLVEGYKYDPHPKLQVVRPSHNLEPMPDAVNVVAVATDNELRAVVAKEQIALDLNNVVGIIDTIMASD
ncbi:molybdopterin-guanine dinucleotide biosynthesis protein B [Porticoccus sp. W117]|uniref:molybdopterin-guanine dinucleotide biosynthesis protein B n=1 Tax=Porticoccus sp. W117 TaxID=3054777 RepID=UPI00259A1808|nr:molybdopterin-guanine dinucleotide biosynthesis protein B [Porticoccus sp. W117]MDM3870377.1 molybdopterin-guanine dinucleotide biosynthesis protein B [Porticoccus sp. W117]